MPPSPADHETGPDNEPLARVSPPPCSATMRADDGAVAANPSPRSPHPVGVGMAPGGEGP